MTSADIGSGLSLCRASQWNQMQRDWEIFLKLSPAGCRVATLDNKVVGTVTTINYQHIFSWIGMVLVDPEQRRQGIGLKLLKEALDVLNNENSVKLDATPAGREVYLKLDFVDEYPLSRMKAIVNKDQLEESVASPLLSTDLDSVSGLDRGIFGADRQALLEWQWQGAPGYAFIIKEDERVQGYCMGRKGFNFTHIGPVIAPDINIAKQLASAALLQCAGKPVILDASHFDPEWMDWLCSLGFEELRPFTRMYRGKNEFLSLPEKQYAIVGPEFG